MESSKPKLKKFLIFQEELAKPKNKRFHTFSLLIENISNISVKEKKVYYTFPYKQAKFSKLKYLYYKILL